MKKNENESYELLEDMASNYLWPNERLPSPKKFFGIHEIDLISKLSTQLTLLTQQLQSNNQQSVHVVQAYSPPSYAYYSGPYQSLEC